MATIYSRVTSRKVRRSVAALTATLMLPSMFLPAVTGVARGAVGRGGVNRAAVEPAPEPVVVNRTAAPPADPNPPALSFSAPPTDVELSSLRVFEEPLVRVAPEGVALEARAGAVSNAQENAALAEAVTSYVRSGGGEDVSAFEAFLARYPETSWRASLELDLGLVTWKAGRFLKAIEQWKDAWARVKASTQELGRAVGDRTVGELAALYARLGRVSELEALLGEVEGRVVSGPGTERLAGAREGLWMMKNLPGESFRCGPAALDRLKAAKDPKAAYDPVLMEAQSTDHGLSLAAVEELSERAGMGLQMAKREAGAEVIVPAVVHWKAEHYAALVKKAEGEAACYELQDPTFKANLRVTAKALDEEASGYCLVRAGKLPAGWRAVSKEEAETVWGKGFYNYLDTRRTTRCDSTAHATCGCGASGTSGVTGMPVYDIQLLLVGLTMSDTPMGYTPPRGPSVYFSINYSERDAAQPATFTYANLGPKWTFDWLAYVEDDTTALSADVSLYVRGGGVQPYTGFVAGGGTGLGTWGLQAQSSTVLARTAYNSGTGATTYERRFRDGSKEVYSQVSAATGARKVFLTQIVDSAGNAVTLNYTSGRLMSLTDAIGQTTTIDYGSTNPALPEYDQIAKVTDPFGRFATFSYTSGHLTGITDVISLSSSFTYETANPDNIATLTTPYGTTSFLRGQDIVGGVPSGDPTDRWIEATDPLGATERVEQRDQTPYVSGNLRTINWALEPVPSGFSSTARSYLEFRNTFFWDKRAYDQAVIRLSGGAVDRTQELDYTKARLTHWLHLDSSTTSGVPESVKQPLENRVWFKYPGQVSPYIYVGTSENKSAIARVLDSGVTQTYAFAYNSAGNVTSQTDPAGRITTISYYTGDLDVYQVKQNTGASYATLATLTYNSQHRPLTYADAAGQTTTLTWNAYGQASTVTNAKSETTTLGYDASGYRTSITGPVTGATIGYTYDAYGRVATKTDADGFVLTYTYDNMDRATRIAFPDLTHVDQTFDSVKKLSVASASDRMGRTMTYTYDALGRMTTATDPKLQTTQYTWCTCGSLTSIVDPNSHATTYDYDVQGRRTKETLADSTFSTYVYETRSSRLKTFTDAKSQTTTYGYNTDDTVSSITYAGSAVTTPNVSYAYDPYYKRPTSRTDGDGTSTFSYYAPGTLGALQPYQVYEPGPAVTTTYTYDQLGRGLSRSSVLGAATIARSVTYDALNRVATTTSLLGTTTIAYDGVTPRPLTASFGTGMAPRSTYTYGGNTDDHRLATVQLGTASLVETFGRRDYGYDADALVTLINFDNAPKSNTFFYDAARQLTDDKILAAVQHHYDYDSAGNRTQETVSGVSTSAVYNNVDELTSTSGGTTATYTYDTNGSVTSDGTRTYTWDGANRLRQIQNGTLKSVFSYDGLSRCTRIQEYSGATLTSDQKYLWSGEEMIGQQLVSGSGSTRLFYPEGMRDATNSKSYVYGRDLLGSVVTMSNTSGVLQTKYDTSDPYGRRVRTTGTVDSSFGFGGYFVHGPSGLSMTHYRFYSPNNGRWLSRDPIGVRGGLNLYRYVKNAPTVFVDSLGLTPGWPGQEKWQASAARTDVSIRASTAAFWPLRDAYELGGVSFPGATNYGESPFVAGYPMTDGYFAGLSGGVGARQKDWGSVGGTIVSMWEGTFALHGGVRTSAFTIDGRTSGSFFDLGMQSVIPSRTDSPSYSFGQAEFDCGASRFGQPFAPGIEFDRQRESDHSCLR